MENLYSESVLDMTEVWPPMPPATRETPAAKPGAGAGGGVEGTPRHHRCLPRGTLSVASKAAVATTATPAVTAAAVTTARTFPRF